MINYRKSLATMLRRLRGSGEENYRITRPTHDIPVKCDNGQDLAELVIHENTLTVRELKQFLNTLPDDAFVRAEEYGDEWSFGGIVIGANTFTKFTDAEYHEMITEHYKSVFNGYVIVKIEGKEYTVKRSKVNAMLKGV